MGNEKKRRSAIYLVVTIVVINMSSYGVKADPQVPCFFIFGDSMLDNGNNNGIVATSAKANYLPHGIDFPQGPTGRFCNGKTTADVVSELLGFDDYIPPYATARGCDILRGVNYASAAAGIREETGLNFGVRISFDGQIDNHKTTVSQLVNILGDEDSVANYLSQCIYAIGMGSNDYLNNYLMPDFYQTSRQYTPDQYADVLIQQYSQQIRTLYNFGARKFVFVGVGLVGCIPYVLARSSPDGSTCNESFNSATQAFNDRLKSLVDNLNTNSPDARFIYINAYGMFQELHDNPQSFGFTVTNEGCCGVGKNHGEITCIPHEIPCENRDEHFFWDAFHPTEAFNVILGRRAYSAESPLDAYPMDIGSLARL